VALPGKKKKRNDFKVLDGGVRTIRVAFQIFSKVDFQQRDGTGIRETAFIQSLLCAR
jgi:hypothetical protein